MREKVDYRENLRRIDENFPNGEMLTLSQVSNYMGIDRRTVKAHFKKEFTIIKGNREQWIISKVALARLMSV